MTAATSGHLPIVVLISGRGSNLNAIIDAMESGELPVEIRAVISNRPEATGLQRAALAGIHTIVIDHACHRTVPRLTAPWARPSTPCSRRWWYLPGSCAS